MTTCECDCPRDLEQLFMIEYPGFVKNVDKALNTLGGFSAIEKVLESQKERLELKFRASDPLAHPAYGDRVPKKCLVLKIRKNKRNGQFKVELDGKINTSYRFDTLAEFQWLPMQRTNSVNIIKAKDLHTGVDIKRTPESLNPTYTNILDDVLPIKNPFDNTLKNFNPDAPLLVLPAIFSRFDTPKEIHQPHPKFRSKEMREEFERQQSMAIIGRTRKKRSTMSYLINYGDPIPQGPEQSLVKERRALPAQDQQIVNKLEECFNKQRIWSKASICYELNCSILDVKYSLPIVAYYYLTGPFRTMWVKYGYDPCKDASSKFLQTLDFRVKNPQDQQEYSKRSIHQYQLPMKRNSEKMKGHLQLDLKSVISSSTNYAAIDETLEDSLSSKNMTITEAMCKFRKDLIPPARQLSYHLKDIELNEVQEIVHSNDGREPIECSRRDGWLPGGSIDKIRELMSKSLHETIDSMTNQLIES